MSHCPRNVTAETPVFRASSDNVWSVYFAGSNFSDSAKKAEAAGEPSIDQNARRCTVCGAPLRGRQQLACSRRCSSRRSARISHAKHSQAGEANHNFKGWRSRRPVVYTKQFKINNPEKVRAHRLVALALHAGVLVRPDRCESCLRLCKKPDAHHPDYSLPLSVEWLCRPCHRGADIVAARLRELRQKDAV